MLSANKLKDYASLRGLSVRDIEAYCDLSAGHISNIFNGERTLTEEAHRQISNAINAAYFAKQNGTFKRQPLDKHKNAIKEIPGIGSASAIAEGVIEPGKKRGRPQKERA